MRPDNQCVICSSHTTGKYCSDVCERGAHAIKEVQLNLRSLTATADKRIYFYDHFLSDLMDQCTVELLRMANSKGPMKAAKYFGRAEKMLRGINTKINRGHISTPLLNNLSELFEKLYHANAMAWQYRSNWDNTTFSDNERAEFAALYLATCNYRYQVKAEIDLLFDGEIHRELL